MKAAWNGYVTAPVIGAVWCAVIAVTVAVAMSFATGAPFRPSWLCLRCCPSLTNSSK